MSSIVARHGLTQNADLHVSWLVLRKKIGSGGWNRTNDLQVMSLTK